MLNKLLIILIWTSSFVFGQIETSKNYSKANFLIGVQFGMFNGVGGQISILATNFAENFPFSAKLSVGLSSLDAGDPLGARRVFINNNTNGIPEENGRTWNYSLDFLYCYSFITLKRNYFYFGPRYLLFTANFNFVGGNEDFDVTSNQWGIGAGVENYFRIVPSLDMVINIGYDFYFPDILYGHDTSYSPDNENVNPREDYNFEDADKVVNQPAGKIKAMIGFSYSL